MSASVNPSLEMKNNLSANHNTGTHFMVSTVKNNGLDLNVDVAVRDAFFHGSTKPLEL